MSEPAERGGPLGHWEVVVVGAGPAGLVAAFRAAERGRRTLLVEKNRKAGVKILMSGGTRCNLTHATDERGIVREFGQQGRFLHSALSVLGPQQVVDMFEAEGVATKVESTGKIFPASNKALDVLRALLRRLERSGCQLALEQPVQAIERQRDAFRIELAAGQITTDKLVLATGGKSYPGCGTVGDGYAWAAALGHTIVPPRPALVPLRTDAAWVLELKGITLPDVTVRVVPREAAAEAASRKKAVLAERRGSLLFTHFGVSGPVVLDVSRAVSSHATPNGLSLVCDFLPGTEPVELDSALAEQTAVCGKRQIPQIAAQWLPQRLADTLIELAGIARDRRAAELARTDRGRLARAMKGTAIPITGTLGYEKAEVTAGGVALAEIDSRTMQSRLAPKLYLAGELLDLDGPIGGYNFQAAFSTGWLAGESV